MAVPGRAAICIFKYREVFKNAAVCSQSGNAPPQPRLGGRLHLSKYRARNLDVDAQNRRWSGPRIWKSADLFKYQNAERHLHFQWRTFATSKPGICPKNGILRVALHAVAAGPDRIKLASPACHAKLCRGGKQNLGKYIFRLHNGYIQWRESNGSQWSHEYRTAAAVRNITLYSVESIYLLSVIVILALLHVALVAMRVALAPGPEARAHFPSVCTFAQAVSAHDPNNQQRTELQLPLKCPSSAEAHANPAMCSPIHARVDSALQEHGHQDARTSCSGCLPCMQGGTSPPCSSRPLPP
eukprot:6178278-Pleurochrysis_carterae.AAC.1